MTAGVVSPVEAGKGRAIDADEQRKAAVPSVTSTSTMGKSFYFTSSSNRVKFAYRQTVWRTFSMKTRILATMVVLLLVFNAIDASAYNPCNPKYDTCK